MSRLSTEDLKWLLEPHIATYVPESATQERDGEWRRKFARVVCLGNSVAPLLSDERAELNALLAEAYAELKTFPGRAAPPQRKEKP